MIHIYSYGLEAGVCEALQTILDGADIKYELHQNKKLSSTPDFTGHSGCSVAIISLLDHPQTPSKLAEQLNSQQFILPTIVVDDHSFKDHDACTVVEPIIDVLAPGPVNLLANAIIREAKIQQYKRFVAHTRKQTKEKNQRLNTLLENMEDGVVVIQDGVYIEVNPAYRRIFGIAEEEPMIGMPVQEFLNNLQNQTLSEATTLNTTIEPLDSDQIHSVQIQKRDGESFVTTLVKSTINLLGKQATQVIIHNPDAWSNVEREFLDLRSQDVDTGLLNRRFFLERMDDVFKNRDHETAGCFAFILLDGFREIRDKFGIKKSDAIILNVAECLVGLCDDEDILCRFGDHCFTLFSQQHDQATFLHHCDSIRQRIEEQIFGTGDAYNQVTISIGVSFINRHVLNPQQLISQADHACDKACENGGNQIQVFKTVPTALDTIEDEETHVASIRSALEDNRLHMMYQPIVNLLDDPYENYAVLLRMVDLDGSQVLPDQFILAAERSHLITELDQWVLHQSIKQLAMDAKKNGNLRLFLKLSVQTIKSTDFLTSLFADLDFHDLNGENIIFQLDYSEAVPEQIFVKRFVHAIKEKTKCKFAFDHVGFGEISDQTIQSFNVDFIKIDGTFTRDLMNNPDFQATIRKILDVTRRHQIPAIAKSVEDANSLAILWNLGVDMVQGYFLQHPSDEMNYDFSMLKQ